MTTRKVSLVKGIDWNNITVSTKKYAGTLAEVNCAVLPAKKNCSENAWNAIGCLSVVWKSYIRLITYPADAKRHESALNKALDEYCAYCGMTHTAWFHNIVISALNVHYNKKEDAFSATSELCFKKNVIRLSMRIQSNTFSITNTVKADKAEKVDKAFNVKNMSAEQICTILGIDLDVWERVTKAQAQKSAC